MKKTFTQTIIVLMILSLITSSQALTQDIVEEENQDVTEAQAKKEADIAQREAEIAAKTAKQEAKIAQEQIKETEKQMFIARDQVGKLKDKLADLRLPKLPKIALPYLQNSGGGSHSEILAFSLQKTYASERVHAPEQNRACRTAQP